MNAIGSMFAIVAQIAGAELVLYKMNPAGATPMIAETIGDLARFYPAADEIFRKSGLPWYISAFGRMTIVTRDGLPAMPIAGDEHEVEAVAHHAIAGAMTLIGAYAKMKGWPDEHYRA